MEYACPVTVGGAIRNFPNGVFFFAVPLHMGINGQDSSTIEALGRQRLLECGMGVGGEVGQKCLVITSKWQD